MLKEQAHLTHKGINSSYDESSLVVIGLPYDGTVSGRDGTRKGPKHVQIYLDSIETWSPYLERDLTEYRVCDLGSMPLSYGSTSRVVSAIKEQSKLIFADGKMILGVGGEHLVTLGLVQGCASRYRDLHIIHFDAHANLRDDDLGEKLSHATVMRRCVEELHTGSLWQFGIRSGSKEEFAFAEQKTRMQRFNFQNLDKAIASIGDAPVYLSVDLDVLDPSVFSGTASPEPGGITYKELLDAFILLKDINIVGADIVELSPLLDASGVSTAVACKTLREVALLMA